MLLRDVITMPLSIAITWVPYTTGSAYVKSGMHNYHTVHVLHKFSMCVVRRKNGGSESHMRTYASQSIDRACTFSANK